MGHHHHGFFHSVGHVFHEIEHAVVPAIEHYAEHEALSLAENGLEHLAEGAVGALL